MKLNLSLLLFCLCTWVLPGQIVTIPDANFKNALLNHIPVIDTNGDNQIQVSEAEAVTDYVNVNSAGIFSLEGIQAFINIHVLKASSNFLTEMPDLSSLFQLEELNLVNNEIQSIDLIQNQALKNIQLGVNGISTLDVSSLSLLETLSLYDNSLSVLDVTQNTQLRNLDLAENGINTMDLSNNTNLQSLRISNSNITTLDISQNTQLEQFIAYETSLSEIDVSQNTALEILVLQFSPITSLDLTTTSIKYLLLTELELTHLNLNGISTLEYFSATHLLIDYLDLSQNPNLCAILVWSSPTLEYLNIKNGNNINLQYGGTCSVSTSSGNGGAGGSSGFRVDGCPSLLQICVDDVAYAEEFFTQVTPNDIFSSNCFLGAPEIEIDEVFLFPNPVKDILTVTSKTTIDSWTLYLVSGQKLANGKLNAQISNLDLTGIPSGFYILSVESKKQKEVHKLVISH